VLAGTVLRELHEATTDHPLAGDQECVIHGDPGPFNTIFQDGLPVAFIDWTGCSPGSLLDDGGLHGVNLVYPDARKRADRPPSNAFARAA
jgi:aminoglycoside phosphotransferase (APT) family kinase protein